eukprot:CAMPEP_0202908116 /NCGR_PEP_ID=MMETSP1392-20130828/44964_1 /ASSEMBLY_ACC=CAM_ASM_000868 /TAXON_ID=225041 /ORGANISM="Chlamydomonas chlamydogama, Strain SAG 11-48b" /LENGTH=137 /DNA_ID=CAMNT_0049597285 /DNA_START=291 /DNA_END=700 /DNA_ORIENTATION=-
MEQAIPETFSCLPEQGSSTLPLRLLNDFAVGVLEGPGKYASLTDVRTRKLCLRGTLVQPNEQPLEEHENDTQQPIQTEAVLDWMIEYGSKPCIWVSTAAAWYKLLAPAADYKATFQPAQRKLDLCSRAAAALQVNPG